MNKEKIAEHCLDIRIDTIVPCLVELETGVVVETVAYKINKNRQLKGFNKANGWNISWANLPKDVEVYALATKKTGEIQGLIGLVNKNCTYYISYASTAPWNNKQLNEKQKYSGVGGHLFAIAVDISSRAGYDGSVYAYAVNEEVLQHYVENLGATYVGILHEYHFIIDVPDAMRLKEVYTYDWN